MWGGPGGAPFMCATECVTLSMLKKQENTRDKDGCAASHAHTCTMSQSQQYIMPATAPP